MRATRFRTRTAAVALLASVSVSLLASAGPAGATPAPGGPGCPALWVLGVQGTGQSSPAASPTTDIGVLGALLGPVVAAAPNLVQRTYIGYPAGFGGAPGAGGGPESYAVSVTAAIRNLDGTARQIVARCPDTELAVAGFSQGAQAGSQFARAVGTGRGPVPADKVAAVLLYADPERTPDSPVFAGRPGQTTPDPAPGTTGRAISAVRITAPPVPGSGIADDHAAYNLLDGRVANICADGDLACAAPGRAAVLRLGAEIAAQADLSNPITAAADLGRLLSGALGNAWTTIVLDDVRLGPGTVDYLPRKPLSQRLIDAADPRVPGPTPQQVSTAGQRWKQITAALATHPAELATLAGELAAAANQLAADDADLVDPGVWIHFAATVARHDDYATTGQFASGIAWLVALAHDLQGHR